MANDDKWIFLIFGIILGGAIVYFLTRGRVVKYREDDKGFTIVEELL